MRVMIIDDDREELELHREALRELCGIEALGEVCAARARERLEGVDLVLVDLHLRPDGADAALRELPPGTRAVVWSGSPFPREWVPGWPRMVKPTTAAGYERLGGDLRRLAGLPPPSAASRTGSTRPLSSA